MRRLITGLATAAALTASLLITGVGSAAEPEATAAGNADARGGGATPNADVPPAVHVDDALFKIVAVMRGTGVQVYSCKDGTATLREPVATLSGRGGTTVIHGKGPFWASFDGSRVDAARPVPPENQFKPAGPNINWLKVDGKPVDAPGVFGNVTFIQRLDTRGGVAPTPCNTPTVSVPYSATYVFWAPK